MKVAATGLKYNEHRAATPRDALFCGADRVAAQTAAGGELAGNARGSD
ncbi:hypothetical protein I8J29_00865 [Paenibacillus sp. MWE-103]|uniref:Uncharacterized protein n=1 Tax=Paenibacillus artemisiicola TaxID=1172618 RepID=A0ABS3W354_9BACL|nr:hypothetical protein [Paenibacillus artemisiicola]MBO7742726.1 hypothetical protein [Paenibacillus artemisiicola]